MYKNRHEQKCFEVILKCIPDIFKYQYDNSRLCIVENRIKNHYDKVPLIFKEAGTGMVNLTSNGNEIRKEILLYFPVIHKKIWIEVKYLSTSTSIRDTIHGEIYRLRNYDGNLILVLLGEGFDTKSIQTYKDVIKEKKLVKRIKIVTNYDNLQKLIEHEHERFKLAA